MKKVSIILCSYNEASNLPTVVEAIKENFDFNKYEPEIIIVNDGSTDNTSQVIEELTTKYAWIYYIEFSRNFGHMQALRAGLNMATGDCAISLDADMQHPPAIIPQFLEQWENGYHVVYTKRLQDSSLSWHKRFTSSLFYKIVNIISDVKLEEGTADFRLLDKIVIDIVRKVPENELFLRGFVKWVGLKQYCIEYVSGKRLSGETKYTICKMLHLAGQGIMSSSTKPLKLALYVGFFISAFSLIILIPYSILIGLTGNPISGWASLMSFLSLIGGIILFVLGIIGLYISKIFNQVKGYPSYIVMNTNIIKEQ